MWYDGLGPPRRRVPKELRSIYSPSIRVFAINLKIKLEELKQEMQKYTDVDIASFRFWLQNTQVFSDQETLEEACVPFEGPVEVYTQIDCIQSRIDILDILTPSEETMTKLLSIHFDAKKKQTGNKD